MTKAASNVESSVSEDKTSLHTASKFSHLHIVFRDWQAEGSDSQSVYQVLFTPERTPDSTTRDRIRSEVLSSFASVRVWLFDAPSDNVADLRTRLTIDRTSLEFRAQIRQLREVLAYQLSEPTLFAGQRITGRSIGPVICGVAGALNSGNIVLPASMFFNMMRYSHIHIHTYTYILPSYIPSSYIHSYRTSLHTFILYYKGICVDNLRTI